MFKLLMSEGLVQILESIGIYLGLLSCDSWWLCIVKINERI